MQTVAPLPPPASLSPYLSESCRSPDRTWGQGHTCRPLIRQKAVKGSTEAQQNQEDFNPQTLERPTSKSTLTDSLEGMDTGVPAQQLQQFIVETEGEGDT